MAISKTLLSLAPQAPCTRKFPVKPSRRLSVVSDSNLLPFFPTAYTAFLAGFNKLIQPILSGANNGEPIVLCILKLCGGTTEPFTYDLVLYAIAALRNAHDDNGERIAEDLCNKMLEVSLSQDIVLSGNTRALTYLCFSNQCVVPPVCVLVCV